MEIGIDSFAAILPDPATGKPPSPTDRMADLLKEVEVTDRAGLDVFGIGEHHRAEFLDSAPAIILAAAAARIDAYAFPMMRWATKLLPNRLKEYPNVQALHDRIAADPAVQRVLAREQAAGHERRGD